MEHNNTFRTIMSSDCDIYYTTIIKSRKHISSQFTKKYSVPDLSKLIFKMDSQCAISDIYDICAGPYKWPRCAWYMYSIHFEESMLQMFQWKP